MPTVPCRSGGFAIVLVLLTGLPLAGCGRAPDPVLPTRPLLERTLPLAADATVALDVAPGAFYVARLDPGGMDVELTLTGSDGRMVKVVGPARGAGHAYLSFAPARAGRATLVVRPQAVAPRDARAVLAVYRLPAALSPRARQAFERWTAVTALGADRDPAAATAATETLAAVEDAWRALGAQPLAADVALQRAAIEYWERDRWDAAIEAAERAAADAGRLREPRLQADAETLAAAARLEIAGVQRSTDPDASERTYALVFTGLDAARARYLASARPVAAAMTLVYAGTAHYARGEASAAIARYRTAEAELAAVGAKRERALVLGNLAVTTFDQGAYADGAREYERLLALLEDADWVRAAALLNSAAALVFVGDYERAVARFLEGLAIAEAHHDARVAARARLGLGVAHLALAEPALAATHLEVAVRALEHSDPPQYVLALLCLADAKRLLGQVAAADRHLGAAAAASARLGTPALSARVALAEADRDLAAGRRAAALARYAVALGAGLPESHAVVGRARLGRARALRLGGALVDADAELAAVVRASTANGNRELLIAAADERARVALARHDRGSALAFATEAVEQSRWLSAGYTNPDAQLAIARRLRAARELRVTLLAEEALAAHGGGRTAEAEAYGLHALEAADPGLTVPRAIDPARVDALDETLRTLSERRYRLEVLADRHAEPTPAMRALEGEIAVLRSRLATLGYAQSLGPLASPDAATAAGFASGDGPAAARRIAALRARVPPDAVLLAYALGQDSSWLWVVDRERFAIQRLPPAGVLERQVAALLDAVRQMHAPANATAAAVALARSILPAEAVPAGRRRLVIPDGALGAVPWALLGDAATRELPALAALEAAPARARVDWRRLVLVADPVFDDGDPRLGGRASAGNPRSALARLRGTAREVAAIAAIAQRSGAASEPATEVRVRTLLGTAATRDALASLGRGDADVLHLATHATLGGEIPALAALVFSRRDAAGRPVAADLRPHDILRLGVRPALVVLSACDTAAEPSRAAAGLLNLTRAFLAHGARDVVASRWAVGDASAVALMTVFYRGLLEQGLEPEAALAAAQRTLAADPRWRAPFHWAGFVVAGAAP